MIKYIQAFAVCFACFFVPYFLGVFLKGSLFFSSELYFFIGGSMYGSYLQKYFYK